MEKNKQTTNSDKDSAGGGNRNKRAANWSNGLERSSGRSKGGGGRANIRLPMDEYEEWKKDNKSKGGRGTDCTVAGMFVFS